MLALAMVIHVPTGRAAVPIPVAVVTCSTCSNAATLITTATAYWAAHDYATPSGYVGILEDWGNCISNPTSGPSIVYVVSTEIAISGAVYGCWIYPKDGPVMRAFPINALSDANAIATDNVVLSRDAADAGRFVFPSNLPLNGAGGSAPDVLLDSYLGSTNGFILKGQEMTPWHGLLNFPQVEEGTFLNTQTGQEFTMYSGDTVTVTDMNGWSAKCEWNPLASPPWQLVPNSIRNASGKPVASLDPNGPSPGGAPQPTGPINASLPGGSSITIWPLENEGNDPPAGTVTVGPLEGAECPNENGTVCPLPD